MDSITQESKMTQAERYRSKARVRRNNAIHAENLANTGKYPGMKAEAVRLRAAAIRYEALAKLAQLGEVK